MNQESRVAVEVKKSFDAPPQAVFAAWLDPVIAAKWLFRTPEGQAVHADIDAVPGGEFCFIERREDEDINHVGEYEVIEAPSRLVFVFSLDQFRTSNRVSIDFVPVGEGTEVTLIHDLDAEWARFADRTRQGWALMLDLLAEVLG
ncbi:MAG: SRPBCC domain-containing protein [Hyphomicrobium sp.]